MNDDEINEGFTNLLDQAQVMAWLCLIGFVGFVAWEVML